MFRLYRPIKHGEFFLVFGDCSQGGADSNFWQFMSKTYLDVPLVFRARGAAAEHTSAMVEALEWLYDKTGIPPVVAYERNNGGASEMQRLFDMNRRNKYRIYYAKDYTDKDRTLSKMGWDTNKLTRPRMLGEWKLAYKNKMVRMYDEDTLNEHKTFIVDKHGRPAASSGKHDDGVMSMAGVWQMYQTEEPDKMNTEIPKFDIPGNDGFF